MGVTGKVTKQAMRQRMVRHMETHHYTQVSRYTSSAVLRMKLGDALERVGVKPHLFEREEVVDALEDRGFTQIRQRVAGLTQFVGGRLDD